MAIMVNNSLTLTMYLNQWVKIASGDRVKLTGGIVLPVNPLSTINTGYFVFRCTECQDNWHVGHENFKGNVQDPSTVVTVPSVLADWVKKHRHVCKKFTNPPATSTGVCQSCKWPYGAHEESWSGQQVFDETGKPLQGMKWGYGGDLPMKSGGQSQTYMFDGSAPTPPSMTLKQFTGRKFRDVEETPLCESPDTSTEKISNE
jgi:hypothetical protein